MIAPSLAGSFSKHRLVYNNLKLGICSFHYPMQMNNDNISNHRCINKNAEFYNSAMQQMRSLHVAPLNYDKKRLKLSDFGSMKGQSMNKYVRKFLQGGMNDQR